MRRRPPRSTRTDTLFPYTTLFRSTKALIKARERLASALGPTTFPQLKSGPTDGDADAIAAMLHRREDSVHAVLSGTLERPVLTGREGDVSRLKGDLSLLVSTARAGSALPASHIEVHTVSDSRGPHQTAQLLTGRDRKRVGGGKRG